MNHMIERSRTAKSHVRQAVEGFCRRFGLRLPILQAPMASASPADLAIAVANAGGMGALGALVTLPEGIRQWAAEVRQISTWAVQLTLWIPVPPPVRDRGREARVRAFLSAWGPPVPPEAGAARPHDFDSQCEAFLEIAPPVVSSIMGLFPGDFV